jgi:hypothetical protein
MSPETKEILVRFDEAGAYEFPAGFDYDDLERRAKLVCTDLESAGTRVAFEGAGYNQDASFSITILLRDYERTLDRALHLPTVVFSNFGNLTTVTLIANFPEGLLRLILASLAQHGFLYVSAEDLDSDYDGVMMERHIFPTWWSRYFDWL